jgi:hypothetical protein
MKKLLVIPFLLLAACTTAQQAVDSASYVCKDGVQYFVYEKMNTNGDASYSVVPHFKVDGTLFSC